MKYKSERLHFGTVRAVVRIDIYMRSYERISEDVDDRLSDDGSIDATDVEVCVNDGL